MDPYKTLGLAQKLLKNDELRKCRKCAKEKLLSDFPKELECRDGIRPTCKECVSAYRKEWRAKNPDYAKTWSKYHPGYDAKRAKKWRSQNRAKIKEYDNKKYKSDLNYRLTKNLRSRMWHALKGINKPSSVIIELGCAWAEFLKYIEAKFTDEMTWSNYGTAWHIDHIRPLCSFDLSDPDQFKHACHYSNLQPLLAQDNMSKGGKYD